MSGAGDRVSFASRPGSSSTRSSPGTASVISEIPSSDSADDDPDWSLPTLPRKPRPVDLSLVAEAVNSTTEAVHSMRSSSTESELGISEMIEALSGLLLAELGLGQAAEKARSLASAPGTVAGRTTELSPGGTVEVQSPVPDTGADHKFDEDERK